MGLSELLETAGGALDRFGPAVVFYAVAALVLASAAYAVLARKIDHCAFSLMACFAGVAGIYAMLGSDFLAVTQVIVYVGGIMVLIIFGVMLTDRLPVEFRQISRETAFQGLAVALPVAVALLWAALGTDWPDHRPRLDPKVAGFRIAAGTPLADARESLEAALGHPVRLEGKGLGEEKVAFPADGDAEGPPPEEAGEPEAPREDPSRRDLLDAVAEQARCDWSLEDGTVVLSRAGGTAKIGVLLLTDYLFPFEFASVLLLVALVGAARLARGGRS